MLEKLKAFDGEKEDSYIVNAIEKKIRGEENHIILAFQPLKTEPDITPILRSHRIALPYVEDGKMHFSLSKEMTRSKLGFSEPRHIPIYFDKALMLVPLLAFDDNNYRLGRGGGYYDRFIMENKERLYTIGIGYSVSHVKTLPIEPFDEKLDEIIYGLAQK